MSAEVCQEYYDDRDIRNTLARFARVVDGKQWDALGEVFCEDLTFNYDGQERASLESLRTMVKRHLECCGRTQHLIGSIDLHIDGDVATTRSYVQARHQGLGEKSRLFLDCNGEYTDYWKRCPDGWRISRREASWAVHQGDPSVLSMSEAQLA